MKAEEFDDMFDRGDFPDWMIASLDREARHLGVTRQAVIKVWIAERLEQGRSAA